MKKTIFFLISIVLFTANVKAIEVSNWTDIYNQDLEIYEEETRYKFYQEREKGSYFLQGIKVNTYTNMDENNLWYGEYSNWKHISECNVGDYYKDAYEIQYKTFYPYKEVVTFKYLIIKAFSSNLFIKNIKVYKNNTELSLEFIDCTNCNYKNDIIVDNTSVLTFQLDDYYTIDDITLEINSNYIDTEINYNIIFSNDLAGNTIASQKSGSNLLNNYTIDKSWFYMISYNNKIYSEEPINKKLSNVVYEPLERCRYREIKAYYYYIEKIYYSDEYYVNIDNYIKDYDDYKIFYRYILNDIKEIPTEESDTEKLQEVDITKEDNSVEIKLDEQDNNNEIPIVTNSNDINLENSYNYENNQNKEYIEKSKIEDSLIKETNEINKNSNINNFKKTNSSSKPLVNILKLPNINNVKNILIILGLLIILILLIIKKCNKNVE